MNENLAEIVAEDTETLPCRYYIWDKDIDEYVETSTTCSAKGDEC